jgi:hypothetical protein
MFLRDNLCGLCGKRLIHQTTKEHGVKYKVTQRI